MKTIGLLGGMSWESTATYYRVINETVSARLGGLHSAKLLLHSVDFAPLEALMSAGDWDAAADLLGRAGAGLRLAGADFLVICTNTMHRVAPQVEQASGLPVLHIADAAAAALREQGVDTAALLGTRFTMEQDFYRLRLEQRGIRALVPPADQRQRLDRIIFDELCRGVVREESRRALHDMTEELVSAGAGGALLGCTELGMLMGRDGATVPVFDTALLHARAAARAALEN